MTRDETLKFLDARIGAALIPLRSRSKEPIFSRWQYHTHAQNDLSQFEAGANVGVVLGDASGGLVDVDLDNPVARALASQLLPRTGLIFERESTPRAHWIYRVTDPGKTLRFQSRQSPTLIGGEKATIIEYRANGAYTMFPPSIHECGEEVRFDEIGEPAVVDRDELILSCRLIAAAVELIPHYQPGKRQDFTLATSGTLLQAGMNPEDLRRLFDAIFTHTHDEEA